ncbi:hypothetical protein Dsin_018157 [Dipteronia sinensis]|uniref:Protein BIG GRAIN 1-like B n=1 Tax=Dipteronia sinensis TaxID=43782 RepID=A0AAE0AGV6_9ROSI|nr:hypothetical protein Dsin_018157 [Dipteronia sinensis]
MYRRDRSLRENSIPQRRRTPSFSSSLLDTIYRSIDESNGGDQEEELGGFYSEKTMVKKQRNCNSSSVNLPREVMIENWIEKQSSRGSLHFNSTSSSSGSSSGGCVFSSSEAESSSYKDKSRRSKQIRSMKCMQFELKNDDKPTKREGGFTKTKLKALKIYGELNKKVKQPISPGGRITSFLNSIFSSGNAKKVNNLCSVKAMDDVNFERKSKSACSSATSFSRSCLSKTPSSRGQNKYNGMKRSVRFYPVGVIVDEDCRPCGHKCIYEDNPSLLPLPNVQKIVKNCSLKEELKNYVMEKETGVGKFLANDYMKKGINELVSRGFGDDGDDEEDEDDDDDDDALSYSSSDLFELDHVIGIGRYREELPVYETTNLKKNQAIANGFIL